MQVGFSVIFTNHYHTSRG